MSTKNEIRVLRAAIVIKGNASKIALAALVIGIIAADWERLALAAATSLVAAAIPCTAVILLARRNMRRVGGA